MLQEREPNALLLGKDDRGECISRRGQPVAERVGDHGHMVAACIHVRQHEEDASLQRRDVAGQDDRTHARTRTDVPFTRQPLDDAARDAKRQPGRLGQFLDCRNRLASLEASVGDLVLDEGAQRVRKEGRAVRRESEVRKKVFHCFRLVGRW